MHELLIAVLRFLLRGLWTSRQERAPPGLDHCGGAGRVPVDVRILQPNNPQAKGAWSGPWLWILAGELIEIACSQREVTGASHARRSKPQPW
jgi:hypothetical protein